MTSDPGVSIVLRPCLRKYFTLIALDGRDDNCHTRPGESIRLLGSVATRRLLLFSARVRNIFHSGRLPQSTFPEKDAFLGGEQPPSREDSAHGAAESTHE